MAIRLLGVCGVLATLELAGCGRIGFAPIDPRDDGGDGGTGNQADTPTDVAIPAGLKIWFRFVQPDLLVDTVSGRAATCTQCPVATTTVRPAGQFDGVDDCMTFDDMGVGEVTTFTLAAWIFRADTTAGMVVGKERAGSSFNSWQCNVDPTDVQFGIYDGSGLNYLTAPALAASWHHVATTFNGVGQMQDIYVDGVHKDNGVAGGNPLFDGNPVKIGCDVISGTLMTPFHGSVADLRFYDRALTAPEIAALAM